MNLRRLLCLLLSHQWEIRRRFSPLFMELVLDMETSAAERASEQSVWYECCKRCGKTMAIWRQTRQSQIQNQEQKGTPSK